MTIKSAIETASPYIQAGMLRLGVTDVVATAREQVVARVPGERAAAVTDFLRTPAGDGLLRLALAGAILALPDSSPQVLREAQKELVVSATTAELTALQDLLVAGATKIQVRLGAGK
jgi:hypothetical protein